MLRYHTIEVHEYIGYGSWGKSKKIKIEKKETDMKLFRLILAAIITLALVLGDGSIRIERTVSAAAKSKKITIKPTPEYTLKIPAAWKNNYTMKKGKNWKNDSLVSFFAKKICKQTGEGFLFGISRYDDDSYLDEPSYDLVGKWNRHNYIAVYPTEIQTIGATKAAIRQYRKLTPATHEVSFSITPVKRKGKNIYRAKGFSLKLPASWKGHYKVDTGKDNSYVSFCAKKCYEEIGQGFLFSIAKYKDESYKELPSYEVVGQWNNVTYVASFPTDVQFIGATEEAVSQYQKLNKSVEKVVRSIAG